MRIARAAALMALAACVCAASLPGGLASQRGPVRVIDTQTGGVVFEGSGAESFVQALLAANDGFASTHEQTAMGAAPAASRTSVERQPLAAVPLADDAARIVGAIDNEFPDIVLLHAQSYEGWRRGRGS